MTLGSPARPPPPPSAAAIRNSSNRSLMDASYNNASDSDMDWTESHMEMETPLITHVSSRKRQQPSTVFRQDPSDTANQRTLSTLYSSISEAKTGDEEEDTATGSSTNRQNSGISWSTYRGSTSASSTSRSLLAKTNHEADDSSLVANADNNNDSEYDFDDRSVSTISTLDSITTHVGNFRESLLLPFTDDEGTVDRTVRGLAALATVGTLLGLFFADDGNDSDTSTTWYDPYVNILSSILGYNYFMLWSVCFYPQVLLNYRRQSTKGISVDFAVLNLCGWTFYSLYNCSMYWDDEIKQLYQKRFADESSVQSNDVLFALHAMLLSLIYLLQIVYYGRKRTMFKTGKRAALGSVLGLKPQTWVLVVGMVGPALVVPLLIRFHFLQFDVWLDYFYVLSFFKICCTLTKYTKQVLLNYQRQSTRGWNIWYNFLECAGGTLSLLQLLLDSWQLHDWSGITGNMAKLALGIATIGFDAIFFVQHYVLYPTEPEGKSQEEEERQAIPGYILGGSAGAITTNGYAAVVSDRLIVTAPSMESYGATSELDLSLESSCGDA